MKTKLAIVYSDRYLDHDTGAHVESPARASAIVEGLEDAPWAERLKWIEPKAATVDEVALIHDRPYIDFIKGSCANARGMKWLDADTPVCSESYDVALLAAGGVLAGIEYVLSGGAENFFAVVRPPGHHAERDEAKGFCLFNNIAIGARYAIEELGLERVFILDWDVHHGNGTQHSLEGDPSVFFCSFHQYPHYPGTGGAAETGVGDGAGFTLNFPMRSGMGNDDYMSLFEKVAAVAITQFRPQLLLVSAGFDAHVEDPLSGTGLTEDGFSAMMECALGVIGPGVPVGLALEGGYNLSSLARSAVAAAGILTGEEVSGYATMAKSPSRAAVALGDELLEKHPYVKGRAQGSPNAPAALLGEEIRRHVGTVGGGRR